VACSRTRQGPAGHGTDPLRRGDFQDGAGIPTADYLLACDLASGTPSATTVDPTHPFSGPVKALTATSDGRLYAGGRFGNLENIPAADNVAYLNGTGWHAMGSGGGPCGCPLDAFVRGLVADGTDVFVGTEGSDVAGTDGWFPAATNIYDLTSVGPHIFATGTFQNANGDGRADNIAFFNGSTWQPVGSNGAGDGPWTAEGSALALIDRQLYAGGNFTSAGGDTQAQSVASFSLTQIIAYPTPTVTSPATSLGRAQISQAMRKATFRFSSGEPGSTYSCQLDKLKLRRCTSPKTYKKLAPGRHVFRVKARDRAGNLDKTPAVSRFRIKRR
jgi:hypothetical protein